MLANITYYIPTLKSRSEGQFGRLNGREIGEYGPDERRVVWPRLLSPRDVSCAVRAPGIILLPSATASRFVTRTSTRQGAWLYSKYFKDPFPRYGTPIVGSHHTRPVKLGNFWSRFFKVLPSNAASRYYHYCRYCHHGYDRKNGQMANFLETVK